MGEVELDETAVEAQGFGELVHVFEGEVAVLEGQSGEVVVGIGDGFGQILDGLVIESGVPQVQTERRSSRLEQANDLVAVEAGDGETDVVERHLLLKALDDHGQGLSVVEEVVLGEVDPLDVGDLVPELLSNLSAQLVEVVVGQVDVLQLVYFEQLHYSHQTPLLQISLSNSSVIPLPHSRRERMHGSSRIPSINSFIPALENLLYLKPERSIFSIMWWASYFTSFFFFSPFFPPPRADFGNLSSSTASVNLCTELRKMSYNILWLHYVVFALLRHNAVVSQQVS